MITDRSQRWRDRRQKFVPNGDLIDATTLAVDVVEDRVAKAFTCRHHYSGTHPAARLCVGLHRNGKGGTSELVGICTFSVPINNASVPKNAGLEDPLAAADLGRLVVLDDVGGNAETFFVSRAFRLLRQEKPGIISIISYADPVRRVDAEGNVVMPGHIGGIYHHLGAQYRGRTCSRRELLLPDGRLLSPRAISKLRNGEQGMGYVIDQLVDAGARRPRASEDLAAWLKGLEGTLLRKRRHPGNHIYSFPLTRAAKIAARDLPCQPYPTIDRSVAAGDVTALPLLQAA